MKRFISACSIVLLSSMPSPAVPIQLAENLDDLLRQSSDIVVARTFDDARTRALTALDRSYSVEIEVLMVLKGNLKTGKNQYETIDPLKLGEIYVLFGHWQLKPTAIRTSPDLDLVKLKGIPLKEQILFVLQDRRDYLKKAIKQLEQEREGLGTIIQTGKMSSGSSIHRIGCAP